MSNKRSIVHIIIYMAFGFWLYCFTCTGFAALDLELTQGVSHAMPMGLLTIGQQWQSLSSANRVDQVIINDLQNSGQFIIKDQENADSKQLLSQYSDSYWQGQKVNAVLQLKLSGHYHIFATLKNVYVGGVTAVQPSAVIWQQRFTVSANQLRALAHHISDMVYQKLTGVPGVFSTKLAYVLVKSNQTQQNQSIYLLQLADQDGFNPTTLLRSPAPIMSPTWSPDGKRLAYVSFENNKQTIYIQDIATGQRFALPHKPGINSAPAFSPDGKQLALVLSWKTGNPKIWLYDFSTGHYKQLTKGWWIDTEPDWSPDGKFIVFTSNRGGTPQVYRYNLQNKSVERMSFDGSYNARPKVSSNDQTLVLMHKSQGSSGFGIGKMALNGNGQVDVLAQGQWDESPSISPNGQMIVYGSQYGGEGVLAMVSMDGKVELRLPADSGKVQEPAWSPYLGS